MHTHARTHTHTHTYTHSYTHTERLLHSLIEHLQIFFLLCSFSVLLHLFNHHTVEDLQVITFSLCRTEYHFFLDAYVCGGGDFVLLVSVSQQHLYSFVCPWECLEKWRYWQAQASSQLVHLSIHGPLLLRVTIQVRFRICQRVWFSFHSWLHTHIHRKYNKQLTA